QRLRDLEAELANFEQQTLRAVTAEQKRQILQLAQDSPRLWAAATTTSKDRAPKVVNLHVRWQGGETETIEVTLPPNRADAVRYAAEFVARVRTLAVDHHDDEITALMTAEGRKSSTGKALTVDMIRWIRFKHRIPAPTAPAGALTVGQVGARYGVSWGVVYYWIQCGVVHAQKRKQTAPYAITIDDDTDQHLRDWVAKSNHLKLTFPNQAA